MKMTLFAFAMALVLGSCGGTGTAAQQSGEAAGDPAATTAADASQPSAAPQFDADSAWQLADAQCQLGPRVPGTPAHARCAAWLHSRLQQWCDSAMVQQAPVTTFDGNKFTLNNIIGVINPAAEQRILLMAHWDCRPWADNDPDASKRTQPVMGANDGASGVAVLLEVARQLSKQQPRVGIDIVLTDLEDWGTNDNESSWALGTQYWANHPHVEGYRPTFGILVDMVGASGAQFAREYFSTHYAGGFVDMVWSTARQAGYDGYFVDRSGGAVTDDHVPVNRAGIPCIDIIDQRMNQPHGFVPQWHTTDDTMAHIDRNTLKAVGQTLLNLIASY